MKYISYQEAISKDDFAERCAALKQYANHLLTRIRTGWVRLRVWAALKIAPSGYFDEE
jgi:hypothetical protein